jgi:hypothetical protein
MLLYSSISPRTSSPSPFWKRIYRSDVKPEEYRDKMRAGEHINSFEDRAVLHVALRNFDDFKIAGSDVDEVSGQSDEVVWPSLSVNPTEPGTLGAVS